MTGKKNQEETLKQLIQKSIIGKGGISKAPPPITPVGGLGYIPPKTSTHKNLELQKELFVSVTGTELMKKWSVGWEAIFDFARQDKLIPYEPERFRSCIKYDVGMLLSIYSPKEREEYFSQWLYRPSDVEAFEIQYGNILDEWRKKVLPEGDKEIAPTPAVSQSHNDQGHTVNPDVFIRGLQVGFINDNSIKIKAPGKKEQEFTCDQMGFEQSEKTWQLLIGVLQREEHSYHVGTYSADKDPVKNRDYNNRAKLLSNVSKKFVSFLNNKDSVSLPDGFKIFKNMKGRELAGTYKPIFQIVDMPDVIHRADIKNMSEEETSKKIAGISKPLKRERDENARNELLIEIGPYLKHARSKGWITEPQARQFISYSDEEASREDALAHLSKLNDINGLNEDE